VPVWDPPKKDDLGDRLDLAKTLVERGSDSEALEQFAWLWQSSLQVSRSWVGVRGSYLIVALRPLVARSPAARARFAAFRDEAEARLPERDAVWDWLTLNDLLGEDDRFVPWLERLDEPTAVELRVVRMHRFLQLVEKFERWSDLARLVQDPVATLRAEHELGVALTCDAPDWTVRDITRSHFARSVRRMASALCRALSATGRTTELWALASEARKLDPSSEMAAAVRFKADP
jgi:hypothetical protein